MTQSQRQPKRKKKRKKVLEICTINHPKWQGEKGNKKKSVLSLVSEKDIEMPREAAPYLSPHGSMSVQENPAKTGSRVTKIYMAAGLSKVL